MSRLAIIVSLAPLALVAACSGEQPEETAGSGASTSTDEPAAATAPATRALGSIYTELDKCRLVEINEEEDWSNSMCDPVGGTTVEIAYADARDDLVLHRKGAVPMALGLPGVGGGRFNTLGPAIEWRGTGNGAAFTATALIVRDRLLANPELPDKYTSYLAVADLSRDCVIAMVRPGPRQNEEARAIADAPSSHACLPDGGWRRHPGK